MKQLVIMPGGFHPFHAGHYSLYQAARRAFPSADVFVAATDDVSQRPFPFQIKEKLAQLAGVEPKHFVRVKSPFRADEITKNYSPDDTQLIFVRSEKDRSKPPQAGGNKRDGSPAYLQPLGDTVAPMSQHGYMTYLPTVEFADGLTSATEIRSAWPALSDQQKLAMVMKLYPRTQNNERLAATVSKMLDTAMLSEGQGWAAQYTSEATLINDPESGIQIRPDGGMGTWTEESLRSNLARKLGNLVEMLRNSNYRNLHYVLYQAGVVENIVKALAELEQFRDRQGRRPVARGREIQLDPVAESDYIEEKWSEKYKRSINCDAPKGFSQRAHCAGRKK
jgi:hypothetical protein